MTKKQLKVIIKVLKEENQRLTKELFIEKKTKKMIEVLVKNEY